MAGSNYSSIEFDSEGRDYPRGSFISPSGVKVSIYKTWLYLYDGNDKPIMEIKEGRLRYKDVEIQAIQTDREILVALSTNETNGPEMYGAGFYIGHDECGESYYRVSERLVNWMKKNKHLPLTAKEVAEKIAKRV